MVLAALILLASVQDNGAARLPQGDGGPELPELRTADLARWREHIVPAQDELRYQEIQWIHSFGEGLEAASSAGRPLLLWAMNGHPLGCT